METALWLLLLFVVVFFAKIARTNRMMKRYRAAALRQQSAQPDADHTAETAAVDHEMSKDRHEVREDR